MDEMAFKYALAIRVQDNATKYTYGTISAMNEFKAMDKLARRAEKEHGGPMVGCKLNLIDQKTGEISDEPYLIMGNTMGDHSDAPLKTYTPRQTSQACEKEQSVSQSVPEFGSGWGR